ncbi:threonine--tRNA ligase [Saccharomycopsis crataegensis]|uniref:Threonine--tRNA ligase, cytoplasmic n=1 Tax=Saccharomycopsis crataegensis TaxID=43959 RepID=A0AAV5QSP4_9ASCO|nr:threonine--tRNA ligase [Saccharomycopsis crataegensis]
MSAEEVAAKVEDLSLEKKAAPAAAPAQPKKKKEKKNNVVASKDFIDPQPEFIDYRVKIFEELQKEYNDSVDAKASQNKEITITLRDGATKPAVAWVTSPLDIANQIGKGFADKQCISKVNGELWDLVRPLEGDCKLEFFDFETDEGKRVFWHSAAHVLGEACECNLGALICLGPPTSEGFFYEFSVGNENSISQSNFGGLENVAKKAIKEKQKFERLVMKKEDLLRMFKYSKYKTYLVQTKVPDGGATTVYRNGPLIDLCVGPHIPHTGKIKAFKLLKNSACYFLGDANNDSLQRIYGIAFPEKKLLTEHLEFLKEAEKRDHRKIGKEQELYYFNEMSPGSCFWLPHGTRIYNTLVDMMKTQYHKRGYQEVITPNMFNTKLWETSGHWQNYQENMFSFEVEKEKYALKPMNCPGHCLVYKFRERSYRELPWRVADFGVLHRNEFSGALSGLTRVRRFQQDDAHIFCRQDQIEDEISGIFDFLQHVYGVFGFDFKMELSTRPDKYIGEIETWNSAEAKLTNALNKFTDKWEINPGDGAFYGPKIDIMISDALKRWFQCATIQLDFQLPQRFDLDFMTDSEARDRPVMIHRAILGSVERMTAILTEHYAGKWPFWLSPRQVLVIPVGAKYEEYAVQVKEKLYAQGFWADVDVSGNTLNKKIRTGQMLKYNFLFIVGEEEQKAGAVNIRNRDIEELQTKTGAVALDDVIKQLTDLKTSQRSDNKI